MEFLKEQIESGKMTEECESCGTTFNVMEVEAGLCDDCGDYWWIIDFKMRDRS